MTRSHRGIRVAGAVLALVLALVASGCGTTEPAGGPPPAPGPGGAPVSLTDGTGRPVTLPRPAARVVVLEWAMVEYVVSLGVMPVGVADPSGYAAWVRAAPLDPSVRDVGIRGEPSIDTIAALRPDVVIGTDRLQDPVVAQIEAFAPVVRIPGGDAADPVGSMKRNVEMTGVVLGRGAEAAALNTAFDRKLEDARARLAPRAGQRFVFADGTETNGQVAIRLFTDGSLVGDVTRRVGLVNGWTEPGDRTYGLAQTDVEGLTRLGDLNFLYIANDVRGGDPFGILAGNAVWTSLPFVQGGRVDRLPDGIWYFGGPRSVEQYLDAVVAALGT